MLSDKFPIKRGVKQDCPLSPILFNLFINDILNKCKKYGVNIWQERCCGELFADDIVLIAPNRKNLQKMLSLVFQWANINKISFGIYKCAIIVVKPINFNQPTRYEEIIGIYFFNNAEVRTKNGMSVNEPGLNWHLYKSFHFLSPIEFFFFFFGPLGRK